MLLEPQHQREPFPFFTTNHTFDEDDCATLERLFLAREGWQARDDSFYSCSLREATDEVPVALRQQVRARMQELTGLPLTESVVVTAQRMDPGQVIGVHSDRPLLGYETARLVLQLNRQWRPGDGGVLELYQAPEQAPTEQLEPRHNVGFGFVLHEGSHHGVSEAIRNRRSVVFNFWHIGNTPQLAEALRSLFADLHFSRLPAALDPIATRAEAENPEEVTLRASLAAWALMRWGYDDAAVVAGYRSSLDETADLSAGNSLDENLVARRIAGWVARLHTDAFDVEAWQALRGAIAGTEPWERLASVWPLVMPTIEPMNPGRG